MAKYTSLVSVVLEFDVWEQMTAESTFYSLHKRPQIKYRVIAGLAYVYNNFRSFWRLVLL